MAADKAARPSARSEVEPAADLGGDAPDLLAGVPLLRGLRPSQLEALAAVCTRHQAEPGQLLCKAGQPSPGLILVLRGRASRSGIDMGPGDWHDEMAALDVRHGDATISAVEPTEYLVLQPRALHDAVRADPAVGVALLREASRRFVLPGEEDSPQLLRYASDIGETFRESERRQLALRQSVMGAIRALVGLAEAKHAWLRGHAGRSAKSARALAQALGFGEDAVGHAALGGLLHDIGYVTVDTAVLAKNVPLSDDERIQIQAHPEIGARIIEHIDFLKPVVPYVLYHHERVDGHGFPRGLAGRSIPAEGRLMAVVETYETLRVPRPGRPAMTRKALLHELRAQINVQLDNELTRTFCQLLDEGQLDD